MLIGGIQKVSFIDFPGKMSCVIFTQGCNFRCPFCHNSSLVDPAQFQSPIPEDEVFEFLLARQKFLDGVVISGGEPTMHKDLKQFIGKIKNLGDAASKKFLIKLDTNGCKPDVVADLVQSNLLDFIAMDVKHVWEKYSDACGTRPEIERIKNSAQFIMKSGIDYEFRTTVVPGIHNAEDIKMIAKQLHGAKKYVIQEFIPDHALNLKLREQKLPSIFDPENENILADIKTECSKYVENFEIRSSAS